MASKGLSRVCYVAHQLLKVSSHRFPITPVQAVRKGIGQAARRQLDSDISAFVAKMRNVLAMHITVVATDCANCFQRIVDDEFVHTSDAVTFTDDELEHRCVNVRFICTAAAKLLPIFEFLCRLFILARRPRQVLANVLQLYGPGLEQESVRPYPCKCASRPNSVLIFAGE